MITCCLCGRRGDRRVRTTASTGGVELRGLRESDAHARGARPPDPSRTPAPPEPFAGEVQAFNRVAGARRTRILHPCVVSGSSSQQPLRSVLACGGGGTNGGRAASPASLRTADEPTAVVAKSDDTRDAGACAGCHRVEAEEWSASLHHSSFTDPDFQASFKVEPLEFCFKCHAPEATGRSDVVGARVGVGCASCHAVASGHGEANVAAQTKSCASCHEFAFPGRTALMQSTMTEHARSSHSDSSCATCHLPRAADGHRDHRFDVSRNVAFLRASVDVRGHRTLSGIEIAIAARNVGHALPTGDLFRRLRVAVRAEAADGRQLGEQEVILARRFDWRRGVPDESQDTRVFGERRVTVDGDWLVGAARVAYEVFYERVAQTVDVEDVRGGLQRRDSVFASVVIAEGTLASVSSPVLGWSPAPRIHEER